MRGYSLLGLVGTAGLLALVHCGGADAEEFPAEPSGSPDGAPGGAAGGGGSGGGFPTSGSGASPGAGGRPPEQERDGTFLAPVATGRYLWAANPQSGRVARIDAITFQVSTVQAGFGPTHLVAVPTDVPGEDRALVINTGSNDATLLRAEANGSLSTETLAVHRGATAWAVSPRGRWAIAWTPAVGAPDPTEGYQDVTVVDLGAEPPETIRLSVGFRPTRAFVASDETRAFFVTESGLSVIDLDPELGPSVSRDFAVSPNPLEDVALDVSVVPDGTLALVRREGVGELGLVSLETGELRSITLPGAITDLDLTADGSAAIAVVRDASYVAVVRTAEIFDDPTAFASVTIDGGDFGSVVAAENASAALLYTNAAPSERVTILDLRAGTSFLSHRAVSVAVPVASALIAPDGAHGIALLDSPSKPGAFAALPVGKTLPPKIQSADAPLAQVAFAPAGTDGASRRAIITERSDVKRSWGVWLVRFPTLQADRFSLASPPLAAGMVAEADRGWVAQEHPEGRITFVDLETGALRTLTGFELGARVQDGN